MSATYFIADLHLSEDTQKTNSLFFKFLDSLKPKDHLYILGDFFDYWIHAVKEDPSDLQCEVLAYLQKIIKQDVKISFMPGNRDFLLNAAILKAAGVEYLPNKPTVIQVYNKKILIAHGDQWCTTDTSYQRYKKIVENKWIQKLFFILPKSIRQKIGNKIRGVSSNKKQSLNKQKKPIDVTIAAIDQNVNRINAAKRINLGYVIHGHTHRFGEHKHVNNVTRLVLGDWHAGKGSFIKLTKGSEPELYNL